MIFLKLGLIYLFILAVSARPSHRHGREHKRNIDEEKREKAKAFLAKYGYTKHTFAQFRHDSNSVIENDGIESDEEALKKFQKNYGLEETGELDENTIKAMETPRCGIPDIMSQEVSSRPNYWRWNKVNLTYSVENFPDEIEKGLVVNIFRKAFDSWSEVVPLDFMDITGMDKKADIKLAFTSGDHGCGSPFMGKGEALAHAFLPPAGIIHFDNDEDWIYMNATAIESGQYQDLLNTAIHEIGHVIGVNHILGSKRAVMYPVYTVTKDNDGHYMPPRLTSDDVTEARKIYGPRTGLTLTGSNHKPVHTHPGHEKRQLPNKCPKDWTYFDKSNKCYYVGGNGTYLNWIHAQFECLWRDSTLTSIHSEEENNFIQYLVKKSPLSKTTVSKHGAWIGGRNAGDHHYVWADDTTWDYTNWGPNEPNRGGNCVNLWHTEENGPWNDMKCYNEVWNKIYVCSKTAGTFETLAQKRQRGPCTDEYIVNPENGFCYKLYDQPLTFEKAEGICHQDGAYLASILSSSESNFLGDNFQSHRSRYVWIGLHNQEGSWKWSDGSILDYENYAPESPSGLEDKGAILDLKSSSSSFLNWMDESLDSEWNGLICKRRSFQ